MAVTEEPQKQILGVHQRAVFWPALQKLIFAVLQFYVVLVIAGRTGLETRPH